MVLNTDIITALGVAALGGTIIGIEREWAQKSAGLRTHMLVSVGAALFLVALPDTTPDAHSRIVQGIAAGVGFIGGGVIMKDSGKVEGITTATTIWIAAAVGSCVASGQQAAGIAGAVLTTLTLVALRRVERWMAHMKRCRK